VVIENELDACPEKKLKVEGFFRTRIIELISELLLGLNLPKNSLVRSVATRIKITNDIMVRVT
jgi:hypothetical protein